MRGGNHRCSIGENGDWVDWGSGAAKGEERQIERTKYKETLPMPVSKIGRAWGRKMGNIGGSKVTLVKSGIHSMTETQL